MKPHLQRNILLAFFCLLLIMLVLFVFHLFVTNGKVLLSKAPQAMDFLAFYTGASLLHQNPPELYNLQTQLTFQNQIAPVTNALQVFLPFLNPPFAALLFFPLAQLPLEVAYTVWVGTNLFLLLLICFVTVKHISKTHWYILALIIFGILSYIPVLTTLLIGQLTIVISLTILLSWICLKKGWQFRGGLLLSLILIKPHFIILPFLAILVQRRWKIFLGLLTGIVFLSLVSFMYVGWGGITNYITVLMSAVNWNNGYGIDIKAQHSLQSYLMILFQTDTLADIRTLWFMCVATIILPTLYIWSKRYPLKSPQFALQYTLLIIATLLISPHTHFHDLTILLTVGIIGVVIIINNQLKQQNLFTNLLLLGYFISSAGYLVELYYQIHARQALILLNVSYLLFLWGTLFWFIYDSKNKIRI